MGNWTSSDAEKFPLTRRKIKKYGWRPDLPDNRDIYVQWPKEVELKAGVDLRSTEFMPSIYDQGALGSCTANALAGAFEFDQKKQKLADFMPSRLFIYYNERAVEGTVDQDSGAAIRDGIKVLNRLGVCPEDDCPYVIDYFTERPSEKAYTDANTHKAVDYRRLQPRVEEVVKALSCGIPVVFGFTVYESFESEQVARTGVMPLPKLGEKVLGGHAVMAVGFDDKKKYLLIRNSWGESFGQKGYFWMPYKFFNARNCADLWIIQRVSPKKEEPTKVKEPAKEPTKEPVSVKQQTPKIEKVDLQFKEESDDEEEELLEDEQQLV